MQATLRYTEAIADNIHTYWFEPEKQVRYVAGQFTELCLPHQSDLRGEKHWFTLSSSPSEPLLAITTKFATGQSSTFKQELRNLKPGARVNLADPMGDFVLPKDPTIPLLYVASGIGVTPVRSMVKQLLDVGERRTIHLIYSAKDEAQLAFRDVFEQYGLTFSPILRAPHNNWDGETGQLTVSRILQEAALLDQPLIYLSGPEHVVERLNRQLKQSGIPEERLATDFFHGYRS